MERLERLAGEVGWLRALTMVAESTERRLTAKLLEQRAGRPSVPAITAVPSTIRAGR